MIIDFIGAFAKLRKANTSFVMFIFPCVRPPSVRLSAAWNTSAATGRIFMTFDQYGFVENMSRKLQE
jgi:hypothetical protein